MSTTQMPPNDLSHRLHAALHASLMQQQLCLHAADLMAARDLHVISHVLTFIARQEAEHGAFMRLLLPGVPPALPAAAPLPHRPEELLRMLIGREEETSGRLLPDAAADAARAGRPRAAEALLRIAETDRGHRARLKALLDALEQGTLLHGSSPVSWFCTGCGCLHNGCDAPESCEGCSRSGSHFIRSDFFPLAIG
ncbi:MAG: hypothetical protein IKK57_07855 [Clostridia bacterium]|nr:hypothetical protein [Clostridia bacterium]